MSPHLELLPAEIKCTILQQIPDMKALRALLRASHQYFLVYKMSKENVLSHTTWNQITPAVLPIAVDALEQREHRGARRNRKAGVAYLKSFRLKALREPYDLSLETSNALLQFHETIEYFISDFTINRLATIKNYVHPGNPRSSPHKTPSGAREAETDFVLSQTEYSRLARAFYLLELYGGLFYTSDSRGDDITVVEQSSLFLQRLRGWELEEFLCIRNCLIERLTDYLNQVEDDFMQDFLEDVPHIVETTSSSNRANIEDWFFSDDGHGQLQEEWLEGCLTRDLSTLRAMLTADTPEDRFDALGSTNSPPTTLSEALGIMPVYHDRQRGGRPVMSCHDVEFHDNVEKYNKAWLWVRKSIRHPRSSTNDRLIEGSRQWGYVIWDHKSKVPQTC